MFLLDTNVLSELGKRKADESVATWVGLHKNTFLFVSAVTVAEIESGIAFMQDGKKKQETTQAMMALLAQHIHRHGCLSFDESCAPYYAAVHAMHKKQGQSVSHEDMMIAAIALRHRLVLATRNTKDFDGIDNLAVINPWKVKI